MLLYSVVTADSVFQKRCCSLCPLDGGLALFEVLNTDSQLVLLLNQGNSGFSWPWEAMIAFKSVENMNTGWLQNEASITLEMRRRTLPQSDGNGGNDASTTAFKYYDGAMHQSYLYPSKGTDTLYCRSKIPQTRDLCDNDIDLVKEKTNRLQSQVDVDKKTCTILQAISKHGILSKTQSAKALMKYVGEYAWDSICVSEPLLV